MLAAPSDPVPYSHRLLNEFDAVRWPASLLETDADVGWKSRLESAPPDIVSAVRKVKCSEETGKSSRVITGSLRKVAGRGGGAMSTQSFELGEHLVFIGEYSWRLKDGELRYRGKGEFAHEVLGRIPVTDAQIERFTDALGLLQVWEWRDDYDPEDIEIGWANSLTWVIEDGRAWWFKARLNERTCRSQAEMRFRRMRITACHRLAAERFALLRTAFHETFAIDVYIQRARCFQERASQLEDKHRHEQREGGERG